MVKLNRLFKYSLSVITSTTLLIGCSIPPQSIDTPQTNNTPVEEQPTTYQFSLNAFGDLLIHNSVFNSAKTGDTYDFTNQFEDIKEKVTNADYTIGNLEVPIGKSDFSNYPSFRAPWQLAKTMKDVLNVELLATASNHTLDKGLKGLKTTLDCLDEVKIKHIGSYRTTEEAKEILIENINGTNVAFLAYTYGTNGYPLPKDNPDAVNIINKNKIKKDASRAKELGADFIILKMHWGEEYNLNENQAQKELATFIFEETDTNLIIGDHPHVVQNIEEITVIKDGKTKKGVVAYSLGNFTSGQTKEFRDTGIILKFNIEIDKKDSSNTGVKSMEYTPVFVDRNPTSSGKNYRVIDINKGISDYESKVDNLISKQEYEQLLKYRDYYKNKLSQDNFIIES